MALFDARDILAYLSGKKCYGHDIITRVSVDSRSLSYEIIIGTFGFTKIYKLYPENIDNIEDPKVIMDDIFQDFRESYHQVMNNN